MNPLIVQSDKTILAEVDSPLYAATRDRLARFAELVKSPEHVHTYRLSDLSLWNAAASGMRLEEIQSTLTGFSKYPVPSGLLSEIELVFHRYGRLTLRKDGSPGTLALEALDDFLFQQILQDDRLAAL